MRKSIALASAVLLALACAPAMAKDAVEVSAADCFLAGFRAGDVDAVTACYAPDAVLWIPGMPMARGHQQIHDLLEGYFAAYTVKAVSLTPMGGNTVGDDAVAWGTFTIVSVAKATGEESTEVGRFVDVSRRIDGKWVYVVDHASDDPPPPGPAADGD